MRFRFAVVPLILSCPAATLRADLFTMNGTTYNVAHISGAGPDQALLEIDLGTAAAPQPILFGFQWDPATLPNPNGRTVLSALQSDASGLTFTDTYYASFNSYLLNTLWYNSIQHPDDYPNSFWLWFTSNDGAAWSEANFGYDQTPITSGGYFGWGWQDNDPNFPTYPTPPIPPDHFPAAVALAPEPASLLILLPAALLLTRRRR